MNQSYNIRIYSNIEVHISFIETPWSYSRRVQDRGWVFILLKKKVLFVVHYSYLIVVMGRKTSYVQGHELCSEACVTPSARRPFPLHHILLSCKRILHLNPKKRKGHLIVKKCPFLSTFCRLIAISFRVGDLIQFFFFFFSTAEKGVLRNTGGRWWEVHQSSGKCYTDLFHYDIDLYHLLCMSFFHILISFTPFWVIYFVLWKRFWNLRTKLSASMHVH